MKNPYNPDTTCYIKYRGEIYECRFTSILVKIPKVANPDTKIQSNIVQIKLDIPNDHIVISHDKWIASDAWSPFNIYSSIEDCMSRRHPLFEKNDNFIWSFTDPLNITYEDLEDTRTVWEYDTDGKYHLVGWRYNTESYTAKKCIFSSHKAIRSSTADITYNYPVYDVINKCWWGDTEWLSRYYSTKEDCLALNAPVIHRF